MFLIMLPMLLGKVEDDMKYNWDTPLVSGQTPRMRMLVYVLAYLAGFLMISSPFLLIFR